MNILYEHYYYLMHETKRPKYLDFYDLNNKDLSMLELYMDQTVRYEGKWFFVKQYKKYFRDKKIRDSAPRNFIRYLYERKMIPVG